MMTGVDNGDDLVESYSYDSATGNTSSKTEMGDYTYSTTHKHAVVSTSEGWSYEYDANGNMIDRDSPDAGDYSYVYGAENRLISVGGSITANFKYDGDGNRVQAILNSVTTAYIGNYYEWTGSTGTMVKYYYAGSQRVAMRTGTAEPKWILTDHLGSTSVVTAFDGTTPVYQRYKPFGETRLTNPLGTKYTFTGQLSHTDDFGLLFFNARWVDPQLARFAQADTLVPDAYNPQDYDRYGYVRSNPLRYVDPSGHGTECGIGDPTCQVGGIPRSTRSSRKYSRFVPLDNTVEFTFSNGGHNSLGTRISSDTVLTHNHFGSPLNAYSAVDPTGISQPLIGSASDPIGQDIVIDPGGVNTGQQSRLITFPSQMAGSAAKIASQQTINGLQDGDVVYITYWDDQSNQVSTGKFQISDVDNLRNGAISVDNSLGILNQGDSGGGVYFNGQLIGNLWSIVGGGHIALVPSGLNEKSIATSLVR